MHFSICLLSCVLFVALFGCARWLVSFQNDLIFTQHYKNIVARKKAVVIIICFSTNLKMTTLTYCTPVKEVSQFRTRYSIILINTYKVLSAVLSTFLLISLNKPILTTNHNNIVFASTRHPPSKTDVSILSCHSLTNCTLTKMMYIFCVPTIILIYLSQMISRSRLNVYYNYSTMICRFFQYYEIISSVSRHIHKIEYNMHSRIESILFNSILQCNFLLTVHFIFMPNSFLFIVHRNIISPQYPYDGDNNNNNSNV